jgi:hypothetical protein
MVGTYLQYRSPNCSYINFSTNYAHAVMKVLTDDATQSNTNIHLRYDCFFFNKKSSGENFQQIFIFVYWESAMF